MQGRTDMYSRVLNGSDDGIWYSEPPEGGGRFLLRNVVKFRVLYICILHFILHFIHIKRHV